jgi:hypothetical protein
MLTPQCSSPTQKMADGGRQSVELLDYAANQTMFLERQNSTQMFLLCGSYFIFPFQHERCQGNIKSTKFFSVLKLKKLIIFEHVNFIFNTL